MLIKPFKQIFFFFDAMWTIFLWMLAKTTVCITKWYLTSSSHIIVWLMSYLCQTEANIGSWQHIRKMTCIMQQIID